MNMMNPRDIQLANEHMFNKKFIDGYIRKELQESPEIMDKLHEGVARLEHWLSQDYYESKNLRLEQLASLDLEELVMNCFVATGYCQKPEMFTSVTAQLAGRLNFSDKADGITTIAEILAVLCLTDAFDIGKLTTQSSLVVKSRFLFSQKLQNYIQQASYLPPMVCCPKTITKNSQNGHLTYDDSVILGNRNHHNDDVCLDVLNKQNQIPLKIDTDFLSSVEEEPTKELDSIEKQKNWHSFKVKSYQFYLMLAKQTGEVYLTNKYDKRGRMYAQGYHLSSQGTGFKKATLEFAEQEVVEGVPAS